MKDFEDFLTNDTNTITYHLNETHTKEYHLFIGNDTLSVCKKMELLSSKSFYNTEKKQEIRQKCCDIGDYVCGICVSSLYKSF